MISTTIIKGGAKFLPKYSKKVADELYIAVEGDGTWDTKKTNHFFEEKSSHIANINTLFTMEENGIFY